MAKLASKVYGEALFQIAVEENRTDEMMEEISAVSKALEENTELQLLMEHPKVIQIGRASCRERVFGLV